MAELVDAHGSGPCAARCGGSNPSVGTITAKDKTESLENLEFQGFFVFSLLCFLQIFWHIHVILHLIFTDAMHSIEQIFPISILNIGREIEEEWETIDPEHIHFWCNEASLLSKRSYFHNGCKATVNVDWKPLAKRYKHDFKLRESIRKNLSPEPDWLKKIVRPVKLRAKVCIEGVNKNSEYSWYPRFFLKHYIYEIFLIANLSSPGAANFYSLSLPSKDKFENDILKLVSFNFDNTWVESLKGNWPFTQSIPLADVLDWYSALNIGIKQKTDTNVERAIFVIYHLCKLDGQIESIIWIFHGLEALFDTKVGENLTSLVRRISLLHNLNLTQSNQLKRKLRKLYDLRSSFVHGNYGVAHPLHHDGIDKRLIADIDKIFSAIEFGFSILITSIQIMIRRKISKLTFEEKLVEDVSSTST